MHKIKKVLVVYKKSFIEVYKQRGGLSRIRDVGLLEAMRRSDAENRLTKGIVLDIIKSFGLECDVFLRGRHDKYGQYDLVVAVGGDGTLFAASHYIKDTPVIGVNSDTKNSLALFSCADRRNFAERFREILGGMINPVLLNRLALRINGRKIRELVMNDVLFTNKTPSAMSRYIMKVTSNGKLRAEEQKSSGVWISTAAGSTASILSAGGEVMPIESQGIQYLVREPYNWNLSPYKLLKGFTAGIEITSIMDNARIYIDGSRLCYDIRFGDKIEMRCSSCPLCLYGYSSAKRRFFIDKAR